MKTIELVLTTPDRDELGRLPLPDVAVAGPGEAGAAVRPRLGRDLTDLRARILAALAREGLVPLLDEIDLGIAVSRALLADDESDAIRIPLPVREASGGAKGGPPGDTGGPAGPRREARAEDVLAGLDDLFDLEGDDTGDGGDGDA